MKMTGKTSNTVILLSIILGFASCAALHRTEPVAGFVPIFDGKSFSGWKAADMSFWSIEDGAITARIT